MKRVLILGASSCIGSNLAVQLREKHLVTGTFFRYRPSLDGVPLLSFEIKKDAPFENFIERLNPDVVIYCPAWREIERCEADPLGARFIHADAPDHIAQTLDQQGGRFIYLSTSKVFSGEKGNYQEDDAPEPIDMYGETKLRGEQKIASHKDWAVLRLGTIYGLSGPGQRSIVSSTLQQLSKKESLPLVCDEDRTFTSSRELGVIIDKLIEHPKPLNQIFHVGNSETETYYTFTKKFAEALNIDAQLIEMTSKEFFKRYNKDEATHRYKNLTLKSDRLSSGIDHTFESTQDSLNILAKQLSFGLQ